MSKSPIGDLRLFVLVVVFFAAGCVTDSRRRIESPSALIEAMRARYDGKWYDTLTFTQQTIRLAGEDADTSIWYEALSIPGRLRIDIGPANSGNGLLFTEDHRYVYQEGTLVFDRPEIHPLLVLGFDVYVLPASETIARLDSLGIDMSAMHERLWQDRPVYVVGAESGDLRSPQFWVDKERLYFVRLIRPDLDDGAGIEDIRFTDYRAVGEAWVAPTVEFWRDDELLVLEKHVDIDVGQALNDSMFNPVTWNAHSDWVEVR